MKRAMAMPAPSRTVPRAAALLLGAALLLSGGCALVPTPAPGSMTPGAQQTCRTWYGALDMQVHAAGVRDAGPRPVAGFPYLRIDRFTASLTDRLPPQTSTAASVPAEHGAWVERLRVLDNQARRFELTNLPLSARQTLARQFGLASDAAALAQFSQGCAARLSATDFASAVQIERLRENLLVPDDYVGAYRVAGLYPIARIPFLAGVRKLETETLRRFAVSTHSASRQTRLQFTPMTDAAWPELQAKDISTILRAASDNALGVPMPNTEQSEQLFRHFAPVWDIGVDGTDDLPGALTWDDGAQHDGFATPVVDIHQPVVYRQLAHTRVGKLSLLQLVYTVWFGARTPTTQPIDLLAGRIDGVVWRVTLSPDGKPLVYDSMHPCGCYHMFFPVDGVAARPAPADASGEWAFSPRAAPTLTSGERLVLRLAAATHYVEGLDVRGADAPTGTVAIYQWRDYDELRSLSLPGGQYRSVFDAHGFMPGTDRLESWLFWPMGIARAGAMRQWGRHATAFVGRRHFDDARLIEKRFDIKATLTDE